MVRVLDAERHAAGAGAVFGGKEAGHTFGLAVDDEIDVALAVQHHVLGAVFGHQGETHTLEHRLQHTCSGRRKLHKLKTHQAHRVVKQIAHGGVSFEMNGVIIPQKGRSFNAICSVSRRHGAGFWR